MYKVLNISGKDYKIEFSVEASLYGECTEKVINLMTAVNEDGDNADSIKAKFKGISDIPQVALSMFYAGLMEHHGTEEGDGEVPDKKTAKILLKSYIKENNGNFWSVMEMLLDQMGEDGFFKLTGLETFMDDLNVAAKPKKTPKKPTDHQKKATAK